jgi:hypothetical protein
VREEYLCFYSSELDLITTNAGCMSVTLDDKAITRGYSLAQELHIAGNRILQASQKLTRLFEEGRQVNLHPRPPVSTVAEVTAVIRQMVDTCR